MKKVISIKLREIEIMRRWSKVSIAIIVKKWTDFAVILFENCYFESF